MLRINYRFLSPLLAAALCMAGCGPAESQSARDVPAAPAESRAYDADAAWANLISGGEKPARRAGEQDLEYFLRSAQSANLRRRELGLEFWEKYPSDPRRYEWLLLAANLAPHYATDMDDWLRQEADHMNVNSSAVDAAALAEWDARYTQMREAFLSAPETSRRQRRLLMFGEFEQEMRRLILAHARRAPVDADPLLNHVVAFLEDFGEPIPDDNIKGDQSFSIIMNKMWDQLFEEHRDVIVWTPASAKPYFARLKPYIQENRLFKNRIKTYKEHFASSNGLPEPVIRRNWQQKERSASQKKWITLNLHSPMYPTDTFEGRFIKGYRDQISWRMYRELGMRLWRTDPDPASQLSWAQQTFYPPLIYAASLDEAARVMARDESRVRGVVEDEAEKRKGEAAFARLRDEYLDWSAPTDAQKAKWIGFEMRPFEVLLSGDQRNEGSAPPLTEAQISDFLNSIRDLYTKYNSGDAVATPVMDIVRYPGRYYLDEGDLNRFMDIFRDSKDERIKTVIAFHDRREGWKTSPVEFTAPIFDGGGEKLSAKDVRGKIVYIDGWATWCTGCIEAMPELHETYLAYKDYGFEFVSMVDDGTKKPRLVRRTLDSLNLTWPVVNTEGNAEAGRVSANYMVLNRDGTVYEYHDRKKRTLAEILDEMLAAEAAARGEEYVPPQ